MNALEIKKFREKHNLSQRELAEIVKTSVRAVRSWEYGERNITQSVVELLRNYEEKTSFVSLSHTETPHTYADLLEIIRKKDEQIANKDQQIKTLLELLKK